MIVYYCTEDKSFADEPEKVIPDGIVANGYDKNTHEVQFLSCPALRDYYKNAFVVKSPCDFSLTIDKTKNEIRTHQYDDAFYDWALLVRSIHHRIFSIQPPTLLFFADKPVMAEQIPTAFHKNGLNQLSLICGTYDIGRHFRRLETAFAANSDMTITIKKGQPLYYLRLLTDEKVELKQFKINDEISSYQKMFKSHRDYTKKITPLNWYYERFVNGGVRKKLLAEIEKAAF